MKIKTFFVLSFTLACSICRGGSIEWNIARWEYDTGYWNYFNEYTLYIKKTIYYNEHFITGVNN